MRHRRNRVFGSRLAHVIAVSIYLAMFGCTTPTRPQEGVVVETVATGLTGARAGIQPDDRITSWHTDGGEGGVLSSPIDFHHVERRHSHLGPMGLTIDRAGQHLEVVLAVGEWGVDARPVWPKTIVEAYLTVRERPEGPERDALAGVLESQGDTETLVWLHSRLGRLAAETRDWDAAHEAFERAHAAAGTDLGLLAASWEVRADAEERDRDPTHAPNAWSEAVEARRALGDTLALAQNLLQLGMISARRGQPGPGLVSIRESHTLWQEQAPESLGASLTENSLGVSAAVRGDLERAAEHFGRALTIQERVAPEGSEIAGTLNNLGNVWRRRGDFEAAEDFYRRSLAVDEAIDPASIRVSRTLNNLGLVAKLRGDLAEAEQLYRRAIAIKEELVPASMELARTLGNLGNVAYERGDLEAAGEHHRQTLRWFEELSPESLTVATNLLLLGDIEKERGTLDEAEGFYRRALDIHRRLAPGSIFEAEAMSRLGAVAHARGSFDAARALFEDALALRRQVAPGGLAAAESLFLLGQLFADEGELTMAMNYFTEGLAIERRLAPESTSTARTLHAMGRVRLAEGDTRRAIPLLVEAVTSLESQQARLGGSQETRSLYGARHERIFKDAVQTLFGSGQNEDAFELLERYRARVLRELLAGRDLLADELATEIQSERRRIHRDYDRAQAELASLSSRDSDQSIATLLSTLRKLREERDQINSRIRASSPRLAALEDPNPLDTNAAQAKLSPGQLLLSFAVMESETLLFSLTASAKLQVFSLPIGEAALRDEVERFRQLVVHSTRAQDSRPALLALSKSLYRELLAPVDALIDSATRLLILADGPLHVLPFAALVRDKSEDRFLVEDVPLHHAVSFTTYAELVDQPRPRASRGVVAFGDAVDSDRPSLPYSREEAIAVARLFGDNGEVYLGADATEARAKSLQEARYVHFASHGVADDRSPLDSYLALSPTFREDERHENNGLLQAWEIFEQVRLQAELVSLSACDSGLGRELGGEGLMGLTRAFHYAGARSIVASLWRVSDRSTAALMVRFYEGLAEGLSKDEALRRAQIDWIQGRILPDGNDDLGLLERLDRWWNGNGSVRSNEASSLEPSLPFHWAAFQLSGDWQ